MAANLLQSFQACETISILHIEDNPGDVRLVRELLKNVDRYYFEWEYAATLKQAIEKSQQSAFDILLLDLSLPDSNGFDTLDAILKVVPDKPVVILTGRCDEELALKAVEKGAQDYLLKGSLDGDLMVRSIRYAVDRKRTEMQLSIMAKYDALTGLANRNLFQDRLQQALLRAKRSSSKVALLFLDLDHFKRINDSYGHDVGDLLLMQVADRLRDCVRAPDTIARLGGDEFTVVLEGIQDKQAVSNIAEKIAQVLSEPFFLEEYEVFTSASVGISLYEGGDLIGNQVLLKHSDMAMYSAKRLGRNTYKFFSPKMNEQAKAYMKLEHDLRSALKRKEFFLQYQPQIDAETNCIVGAEALLRWQHPKMGVMHPAAFISIMEESDLIVEAGEWVLREACKEWCSWLENGYLPINCVISINLSARQFQQQNLAKVVQNVLRETGLNPENLDLEITENILLKNNAANVDLLEELKILGVSISIDDFGTGFSSLNYLKHFPVDRLKIDRSFVKDILNNEKDGAIVSSIMSLAGNLGLEVVVEGVDDQDKLAALRRRGCRIFQGYYFSRPVNSDLFIGRYCDNAVVTD